jgi:predicted MFS family arabinose efflux permease
VDLLGFKRASVLAPLMSAAMVAAIPLLYLAGVLEFWQFLLLVFLVAMFNAPGELARRALIPTLARVAAMPIERANAADTAIPRVAQLAGPVLGGVAIALFGAANVLLADAATFAASAALIAIGVPSSAGAHREDEADSERAHHGPRRHVRQLFANPTLLRDPARRYLSELLEGLRFVRTNALLLSMVLLATAVNLLEKPFVSVIVPVYVNTFYGSAASLGVMLAAFGAGALVGTFLFGAVGVRWPRRLTFLSCLVAAPMILFGTFAATPPLAIMVAAVTVAGLLIGPTSILFVTVIQENIPTHMQGRVFGALSALAMAGIPLGAVLAGFVVEGVGLVPTIVGMGAIYLAVTVGMFFNPTLRRMDTGWG